MINSERQLLIDEEVQSALKRSDYMTPERLILIDAILTLLDTSAEKECQRRIAAINAVMAYCGMKEGTSYRHGQPDRFREDDVSTVIKVEEPALSQSDIALNEVILSIRTDKRPTICFLCLENPKLPIQDRVSLFSSPGYLSKLFREKHVKKLKSRETVECRVCGVLVHRMHLQSHAEKFHGTVSQVST